MGHDQLAYSLIQSQADLVSHWLSNIWALTRENTSSKVCEQQRRRTACISLHTVQHLFFHLLENIISKLATREISLFYLVYVAEQAGLGMTWSEATKTGFLASKPICVHSYSLYWILPFI